MADCGFAWYYEDYDDEVGLYSLVVNHGTVK